jgi:hypothetical protein
MEVVSPIAPSGFLPGPVPSSISTDRKPQDRAWRDGSGCSGAALSERPGVDATRSAPENVNPPDGDHRHGNEQINESIREDPQVIGMT